jgi:uncharacterized membrane protein
MSRSLRALGQAALGGILITTGTGHLTSLRKEFQAQVPSWFPADPDKVVLASGVVELAIGAALLTTWRQPARQRLGKAVAAFFVGIFPGNIAQYTERKDGFGLDTDNKRALRLLGQPVLIAWVLASTRSPVREDR